MSLTYLDYNATTPVWPQVVDAVSNTLTHIGNPSSVHSLGAKARKLVDESREKVAAFINCEPKQVVFTSGGTEANNLALNQSNKDKILVSSIEHESILDACNNSNKIAVTMDGVIDLYNLESIDSPQTNFFRHLDKNFEETLEKRKNLSSTIDIINSRFGRDSVTIGSLPKNISQFSGTKVAFTRIPDIKEFYEYGNGGYISKISVKYR